MTVDCIDPRNRSRDDPEGAACDGRQEDGRDDDGDRRIDGTWRCVTASVTDRSDMRYDVLLGQDVLEAYTLDISRRVEE